jgi:hypothetical protein
MVHLRNNGIRTGFAVAIASGVAVNWLLRILSTNEVFYVWYPLFWWFIFGAAYFIFHSNKIIEDQALTTVGPGKTAR